MLSCLAAWINENFCWNKKAAVLLTLQLTCLVISVQFSELCKQKWHFNLHTWNLYLMHLYCYDCDHEFAVNFALFYLYLVNSWPQKIDKVRYCIYVQLQRLGLKHIVKHSCRCLILLTTSSSGTTWLVSFTTCVYIETSTVWKLYSVNY